MRKVTYTGLLLAMCAALSFNVYAQEFTDQDKQDAIQLARKLAEKAQMVPQDIYEKLAVANSTPMANFSDEQLEKLLKGVLSLFIPNTDESQEIRMALSNIQSTLIKQLKSYRVTGYSFAIDPNGALLVDNQDPEFVVAYKDGRGGFKTRRYAASIDSVGLKIEFAINFDLIFFTGTAVNFYESDKKIELGTGFSMSPWPITQSLNLVFGERNPAFNGLDPFEPLFLLPDYIRYTNFILDRLAISYVPFKNMPGGLCILHGKVGLHGFDMSVITGGTLTPLA